MYLTLLLTLLKSFLRKSSRESLELQIPHLTILGIPAFASVTDIHVLHSDRHPCLLMTYIRHDQLNGSGW